MTGDVTVVIPAYNAIRYLGETLESVQHQSLRASETIVIDDGSTDDTGTAARGYGVTLITQTNRGLTKTRNVGIARARTKWVAFLDADDVWRPEMLERSLSALAAAPVARFAFCEFEQFEDNNLLVSHAIQQRHPWFANVQRTQVAPSVWLCDQTSLNDAIMRGSMILPSALVVERQLLLELGCWEERMGNYSDIELNLRLINNAAPVFIDVPLLRYRKHDMQMSTDLSDVRADAASMISIIKESPQNYSARTVKYYRRHESEMQKKAGRMAVWNRKPRQGLPWLYKSWRGKPRLETAAWIALAHCQLAVNALRRRRTFAQAKPDVK